MDQAVWSVPGAGTVVEAFGRNLIRMTAAETGGRMGVLEVRLQAGDGTPLHVHDREDEFFHVLEGRFAFWCSDKRVELDAGGAVLLPRGIPHRLENIGSRHGRLLVIVTPGGFEGFFAAAAGRALDEVVEVAAGFGLGFPDTSVITDRGSASS